MTDIAPPSEELSERASERMTMETQLEKLKAQNAKILDEKKQVTAVNADLMAQLKAAQADAERLQADAAKRVESLASRLKNHEYDQPVMRAFESMFVVPPAYVKVMLEQGLNDTLQLRYDADQGRPVFTGPDGSPVTFEDEVPTGSKNELDKYRRQQRELTFDDDHSAMEPVLYKALRKLAPQVEWDHLFKGPSANGGGIKPSLNYSTVPDKPKQSPPAPNKSFGLK